VIILLVIFKGKLGSPQFSVKTIFGQRCSAKEFPVHSAELREIIGKETEFQEEFQKEFQKEKIKN